jgi:DNA (cytosine-5)-methyltransferase 1
MQNINWAPLISLIGGFPLGAEAAFGKPPVANISYDGFQKNDSHYNNYNEQRDVNVPYYTVSESPKQKIDVIVGTPPCAALSQLNTGKTAAAKGAGCHKNEWMYKVFEDAIDTFGARVVVVENAPALYTTKGQGVADQLYKIAKERDYSLTLYKTSTMYHGIPQNRQRTFAIAWDSKTAPIMNWYRRDRKNFAEYLQEVPSNAPQQDMIINPNVYNDYYFQYIKHATGEDPRKLMIEAGINTAYQYVLRNFGLNNALGWFKENNHEKGVKYASHAMMKTEKGLGIWDGSTHVFDEVMNAVIGRNLNDTIHPTEDRSLTVREAFHMMGFPHDFQLLGGRGRINEIAQNVPVCTARDICIEISKYLNNELEMSDATYIKQSNFNYKIEYVEKEINQLTKFFE